MAPPTALEKAEAERRAIEIHLDLLENQLQANHTTPLTETEVGTYLREAEQNRTQLIDNNKAIILAASKTVDMDPYIQEFKELSIKALRLHSGFHRLLMAFPPSGPPPTHHAAPPPHPPHQSIRLPAIELPRFSGNLQEWVSFRDLYITAIHNSSLTKVEKLTQLKSLLTGEAARQVRSLVLSDNNYDIAWTSLMERYENNRELLFSILRRLITQPVIGTCTATNIRSLVDTTKECVRSLEVLAIPTQHWDAVLLYLLFSKLDNTSREQWEQSLPDTSVPPLAKMYEFLEQRARALAASTAPAIGPRNQGKPQQQGVRAHHTAPTQCVQGCNPGHHLFRCPSFLALTPQQRMEIVRKNNLCLNCLFDGHIAVSCPSKHNCKQCNKRHNTLLHLDGGRQQQGGRAPQPPPSNQQQQQSCVNNHYVAPQTNIKTGVLATARIQIKSRSGPQPFRALIDGGSTNTHITEQAARQLQLPLQRCKIPMSGLEDSSVGVAKYVTSFSFTPHFNSNKCYVTTALVVKSIGSNIPYSKLGREHWPHLSRLQLADPDFHVPALVDVLIGTDVFWEILGSNKVEGIHGQPIGFNSTLGWLVGGANSSATPISLGHQAYTINTDLGLKKQLVKIISHQLIIEIYQDALR